MDIHGKVVIIGQHTGNMGDEIAGCALLEKLVTDCSVSQVTVLYRGYDKRELEINDQKIIHETSLSLSKLDVVNLIICGFFIKKSKPFWYIASSNLRKMDTLFEEAETIVVSPSGANIGIYQDERLLSMSLLAVAKGKTPLFHYCTIGKSRSVIFDWIAKYMLKRAKLYFREKKSMEYAESIGISNAVFGYDTAFSFKRVLEPRAEIKDLLINSPVVMIITQLHTWHPNYVNTTDDDAVINNVLVPFIMKIAERENKEIILLPHILQQSELYFLSSFLKSIPGKIRKMVRIANIQSVSEYDYVIENASVVITMRYHGIVVAAKNRVPFLAISYENKMQEVASYIGCPENCVSLHKLISDSSIFEREFFRVWSRRNVISEKLNDFILNLDNRS